MVHPSSDPDPNRERMVDEALRAARVDVDAGERLRLNKLLRRLAPVAAPGDLSGARPAEPAADFEQALRDLARG